MQLFMFYESEKKIQLLLSSLELNYLFCNEGGGV
jgi:hypothetical protein